jgi:hypothetical protein
MRSTWQTIQPQSKKIKVLAKFLTIQVPIQKYCTDTSAPVNAIAVNDRIVKMIYQQHCHDVARNVQFKAGYHPLKTVLLDNDRELHPLKTLDPSTTQLAKLKAQPTDTIVPDNTANL